MPLDDDQKLVFQTLSGDREAFSQLIQKYRDMVYAYVLVKVGNPRDTDDVMQEIFMRAYRHLNKLQYPYRFGNWLYTIMVNECNRWLKQALKRRQREISIEEIDKSILQETPEYARATGNWEVDLEQAFSELSDDNKVALSMFYTSKCSLKEIAEFLGVSENTVKGKLHRARQQLGRKLEPYRRTVKNKGLKGGFVAQVMNQISRTPAPSLSFTGWSGASLGKTVFALITTICILIGGIVVQNASITVRAPDQIGAGSEGTERGTSIEVVLLTDIPEVPSAPSPVVPSRTGSRPPGGPAGGSTEQGRLMRARDGTDRTPQFSTAVTETEIEKLIFAGRVIDGAGLPVAGVEILYPVGSNPLKSVTRTRGDGTFRFELPRSQFKKSGYAEIVATHRDYAFGWQTVLREGSTNTVLQLSTAGQISGKIMNEAGEPIQDAEVRIQYVSGGIIEERLAMSSIPIASVKTDATGAFVLHTLPEGTQIALTIQAEGYAKQKLVSIQVGVEGLEFRLIRAGRIEGHLSYATTGAPVQGAIVALNNALHLDRWEHAHTDANGYYLLKDLAPGIYNLFLNEGPEGWTAAAKVSIKVVEGETVSNVDFTLVRGGFIGGRVTDEATKAPLVNHVIYLKDAARPESQKQVHFTETDESGAYFFPAVLPGRALVYAFASSGYQDIGSVRRYVDVVEAKTVIANFQLSKGIALMGRAFTETGEPVVDAKIINLQWAHELNLSNAHGEFTLRQLRPGQKLVLKAEHRGLKLRGTVAVEVQPGASVEIQMQPYELIRISGRVLNDKGEPVPSVTIGLMHHFHTNPHIQTMPTVSLTDSDGRFKGVELIVGDQYTLSASANGYQPVQTDQFTVTASLSQIADLVLLPAAGPFFIEGRLTDTAGQPVHGAEVHITTKTQRWATFTDENGDYRFEELPTPQIGQLGIAHSEYAYHVFKGLKSNQRHDLVLVKADGYLTGKILDVNGKPIEGATVGVHITEEEPTGYVYVLVLTNALGTFELKHIKDKVVQLYVRHKRNRKIFKDIAVNQRNLVLTLTAAKP